MVLLRQVLSRLRVENVHSEVGGAGGGGYGPPVPPYFAAFEVVEQLKVTQCG